MRCVNGFCRVSEALTVHLGLQVPEALRDFLYVISHCYSCQRNSLCLNVISNLSVGLQGPPGPPGPPGQKVCNLTTVILLA